VRVCAHLPPASVRPSFRPQNRKTPLPFYLLPQTSEAENIEKDFAVLPSAVWVDDLSHNQCYIFNIDMGEKISQFDNDEKRSELFITRHSVKPNEADPESPDHVGVSESGVEQARERAREIIDMVESAPKGAVVWLGGSSSLERTKTTSRIYAEELQNHFSGSGDVIFLMEDDVHEMAREHGYKKTVDDINAMDAAGEKKIVISTPLTIKNFLDSGWLTPEGDLADYTKRLLNKQKDEQLTAPQTYHEWFKDEGKIEGVQAGPNPTEVAKSMANGLKRLKQFGEKCFPGRPLMIGSVGHSGGMTAFAHYVKGGGKIDLDEYEELPDIKDTDMFKVSLDENNINLEYAGESYQTSIDDDQAPLPKIQS